ncbi:hypothetical protein QQ045_021552 [Rhodiola kirilowii]
MTRQTIENPHGWMPSIAKTSLQDVPFMSLQKRTKKTFFAWTVVSAYVLTASPLIASTAFFKFVVTCTMKLSGLKILRNL